MEPFIRLTGVAAPIEGSNIDTDQILPARFLKADRAKGYGQYFFHDARFDEEGREKPDFVLNREPFRHATIVVADENFGCGSSREGAVYALHDFGIRAVIAPSFGDIFYNNCLKNGAVPVQLDRAIVTGLLDLLQSGGRPEITVDLDALEVALPDGSRRAFRLDAFWRECLMKGVDEIELTLGYLDRIEAFERDYHGEMSWLGSGRPRRPSLRTRTARQDDQQRGEWQMTDDKSGLDTTKAGQSRRDLLKAGGSTLALAAVGTVAAPAVLRAQVPVIKIGAINPMTGGLAYNGQQAKAGFQFAIDAINESGGIKSMGGAKLELIVADAESRPDVAAAQVDKLADAGVSCLVGCQSSALTLAASQAAAKFNLPMLVDVGTADQVVLRGLPNVFRFSPGTARSVEQGMAALKSLNEAAGNPVKTVAIVHEDGPFGSSMAKVLNEKLPSLGLTVVETISHPTPQRDFTNIVLRLKNAKPDLVMPSHYLNEFILFARTMRQQRFSPKAIYSIFGGGASNPKFVRENQDAAQFVIDTNHYYDPRKPASQALAKKVAEAKLDNTYDVMVAYGTMQVVGSALEAAKSGDRAKLIETLTTQTFPETIMPYGPIKFEKGDNTGSRLVNVQVRGDKIEVIFPKEFATVEPVFPMPDRG